jgi:hypothetical protein
MKIRYFLLSLLAIVGGCSSDRSPKGTVSSVMDEVITRLYSQVSPEQYSTIDDAYILNFLTEEEKQILATRYQYFTVNVPVVVSVMRDVKQETVPFWLEPSGFVKTSMTVKSESYTYEVWQKKFDAGLVELGINGFDKHRPVYFVAVAPQNEADKLVISEAYPSEYNLAVLEEGAFTYHDWSDLLLVEIPDELKGQQMFTTVRGRAREAHIKGGFRKTPYPSSREPDQVVLTWSESPLNSIDIQWRTDTTVSEGVALVWQSGASDTLTVDASVYRMQDRMLMNDRYINRFTANVKNLQPGTKYNYRVGSAKSNTWSDVASFETATDKPAFSFVWFGDTHCFPDSGKLATLASRHKEIAFYTIAGDIVSTGLNRDDWDRFFEHSRGIFSTKPLMPVPGNHDRQDGLGAKMYYDLFSFPKNGPDGVDKESTYAFEYANALFLMIDATSDWDAHTPWIEEQLKNTKAQWKFAIFHFPPYNFEEPYPELQEKWVPLFDKYHVDMVIGGHVHYYMRSNPMKGGRVVDSYDDGTVYAISISIPWKHDQLAEEPYAVLQYPEGYFYQWMEIDGGVLKYRAYDQNGVLRDQFSIKKK